MHDVAPRRVYTWKHGENTVVSCEAFVQPARDISEHKRQMSGDCLRMSY